MRPTLKTGQVIDVYDLDTASISQVRVTQFRKSQLYVLGHTYGYTSRKLQTPWIFSWNESEERWEGGWANLWRREEADRD